MVGLPSLRSAFCKGILSSLLVVSMGVLSFPPAYAATTPSLGAASTYAVLGSTYTNTTAGTVVNGDIGFTTPPAVTPGGSRTNYGSGGPYASAGIDQGSALSALASQPCTFTFAPGAVNLSTDTTHGAIGVYAPGVYCGTGAMDIGGPLLLSGNGTYIFRPDGALTSTAGAVVTLAGASACDVFWTPTAATTLAANTTFAGTVIANAGVTVGANVTWTGRSLAFGGTVTTDTDTINVPGCAVALASSASSSSSSSSAISSSASSASSATSSQLSSSVQSSSSQSSSIASSSASSTRSVIARRILPPAPLPPAPVPAPEVTFLPNSGVGPQTPMEDVMSVWEPQADADSPVRLRIPSINVDAVIESVGRTPKGAMDMPDDPDTVGWYNRGSRPGTHGSAVLAGHLDWYNGKTGVFQHLDRLRKGDVFSVETDTGKFLTFVVREIRTYDPDEPAPDVFQSSGGNHLNLVTCSGAWDSVRKIYSERLVVFAEAVEIMSIAFGGQRAK